MAGRSVGEMQRREFLRIAGAASLAPGALHARTRAADASPAATVLYEDRAIQLDRTGRDPRRVADALWVRTRDLPRINGFELKPQGACRADLCIPIPQAFVRGGYFNLTAFAKKAGQSVVAAPDARVWSFGEMQALGGGFVSSRIAPDFAVPDRAGRPVHLSAFRGKKVLVVTWASW
jgi:hypothetical protein